MVHWTIQFPRKHQHLKREALETRHLLSPQHQVDGWGVVEGIHGLHHHAFTCDGVNEVESDCHGEQEGVLEHDAENKAATLERDGSLKMHLICEKKTNKQTMAIEICDI